jgi:aminobenzoyl-glutamate transport protein
MLFVVALLLVWLGSWVLAGRSFSVPAQDGARTFEVQNQLTGRAMATFVSTMVTTFTGFAPLGVVLVAWLGLGVAERTGFVHAGLQASIGLLPRWLLSPMLLVVAIVSHAVVDAGYVLVIPLGGALFYTAGRHPLAGIACAFAGVSGGFGASFIPPGLDPQLQGITQSAAWIFDPTRQLLPQCNWVFASLSCIPIVAIGWFLTDRVIEPRLRATTIDGDGPRAIDRHALSAVERRGLWAGVAAIAIGIVLVGLWLAPDDSPLLEAASSITAHDVPITSTIVPLIFLLLLIPGVVFGLVVGTIASHRDVVRGMTEAVSTAGYYVVAIFFFAQLTAAFGRSNLGAFVAVEGAGLFAAMPLPGAATVCGVVLVSALANLLIGSAPDKWALLAPILVPDMMQLGLSPELTQAAYRVGDSATNVVTPLVPYFPLVVAFCRRWVKSSGFGTVTFLMLPYAVSIGVVWTTFLILYWMADVPLGLQSSYAYP